MAKRIREALPLLPFFALVAIFLIVPTVTVIVSAFFVDGAFSLDREVRSGQQFEAPIALDAPADAGAWLLVLDVETPETPSLVAAGSPATVVRVTVTPAAPTDVGPPRD